MNKCFITILILSCFISGCFQAPEFPNTPILEYQGIEITNSVIDPCEDIAKITLAFTDGDGDIGIEENTNDDILIGDVAEEGEILSGFFSINAANADDLLLRECGTNINLVDSVGSNGSLGGSYRFEIVSNRANFYYTPKLNTNSGIDTICIEASIDGANFSENMIIQPVFIPNDPSVTIELLNLASKNLVLRSIRQKCNGIVDTFFDYISIPKIPQNGSVDDIEGTITIDLASSEEEQANRGYLECISCGVNPEDDIDTIKYDIYLIDRSNNRSNVVSTEDIIFSCRDCF